MSIQQWQEVPVPPGAAIAFTGYDLICSKEEMHYFKADKPKPGDRCNCRRAVYREDGYCQVNPLAASATL